MKGFILAAGFGQRMLPLTESLPKPLLTVGRLPLVVYAIKLLAYHGIRDIVINVHHLAEMIEAKLGDGSQFGVALTYSVEGEILGTGGGLKRMHQHLSERFVVINSDTLFDLDLARVIEEHDRRGALATMVLRKETQGQAYSSIEIDSGGRLARILGQTQGQAIAPEPKLTPLMFTGVHVLEPRFLEYIPPDVNTCIIRYGYMKALKNGEPLFGSVTTDRWADAGEPAVYVATNLAALRGELKMRHADPLAGFAHAPKADVDDAVRMGERVVLAPTTRLTGPLTLDDDVTIGADAKVGPETLIGSGATLGRGCSVHRAVVLEGAKIEADAQISGAVIGKKAKLLLPS